MKSDFENFCLPAKVYVVLSIIGIVAGIPIHIRFGLGNTVLSILIGLIVTYLFTWIVNIICVHLSVTWAWILVFGLPILYFILLIFFLIYIFKWYLKTEDKKHLKHLNRKHNRHVK